jgi:tRNA threonylcarbamoyladenosine biosynthesis protein TsaE
VRSLVCADVDATRAVAASISRLLCPGDVILLDGELGAGKTTFTQGLARSLGVSEAVTSPTFTLVRSYRTESGFDLLHVDAYRLDQVTEVIDLALSEALDEGAVAVIEWGQKAAAALLPDYLQVTFEMTDNDGERILTVESVGPSWEHRVGQL